MPWSLHWVLHVCSCWTWKSIWDGLGVMFTPRQDRSNEFRIPKIDLSQLRPNPCLVWPITRCDILCPSGTEFKGCRWLFFSSTVVVFMQQPAAFGRLAFGLQAQSRGCVKLVGAIKAGCVKTGLSKSWFVKKPVGVKVGFCKCWSVQCRWSV